MSERLVLLGMLLTAGSGVPGLFLSRRSTFGQWLANGLVVLGSLLGFAGVANYLAVITRNLQAAARQGDLIVRHLLLPGHFDCCYRPIVGWLAARPVHPRLIVVAAGGQSAQLTLPRALAAFVRQHADWQVRVQVRRGLIAWRGRDLPATAVIGVRFTDKDVKPGAG